MRGLQEDARKSRAEVRSPVSQPHVLPYSMTFSFLYILQDVSYVYVHKMLYGVHLIYFAF